MKRIAIIAALMVAATSPASARGLVVVQVPNSGVIYGSNGPSDGCHGDACWYHHTMTYLRIRDHGLPPLKPDSDWANNHVRPDGFDASDGCEDSHVYCIKSDYPPAKKESK